MKNTKTFNKLVRDRIPEIIESKGERCLTRVLTQEEYKKALVEKLKEEVKELQENICIEEVADVLEVLDCLCHEYGFNKKEILNFQKIKRQKRGSFSKKLFLKKTFKN